MPGVSRYQNPEVYERLAAEYVLGTLHGPARRRFESLMRRHRFLRFAVDDWREKLGAMVEFLPEIEPPARVLANVHREIAAQRRVHQGASRVPWWKRLGFWQGATALTSLLLLIALAPRLGGEMPMPSYVAVLEGEGDTPMMVTLGDRSRGIVTVRLMEMPRLAADQDLQLWAIHRTSQQAKPVALIPRDRMEAQFKFTRAEWQHLLRDTEMFAVSFEPKGGSPTASPSGPIMYKGKCVEFI